MHLSSVIPIRPLIVPNGIDLSEFENLPQRGEFRKKWGINDSQKIILYLARIHKNKVLEAMAMGKPVVSTSIGGLGINVLPEKNIIIADEPEDFARRIIELFNDEQLRKKIRT